MGRREATLWGRLAMGLAWMPTLALAQAVFQWNGSSNNQWGNSANWTLVSGTDDDGVPDGNDNVFLPAGPTYASGIVLGGTQACDRITWTNNTSFTLGQAGELLRVSSGSVWRELGSTNEHVIACDLQLDSPDGTNVIQVTVGETYLTPSRQLRVDGRIMTTGILRKTGGGGKLTLTNPNNSFGGGPRIEGGVLEVRGVTVASALGEYPITLDGASWLYVRNLDQTLTNEIVLTGSLGSIPRIVAYDCTLTLKGAIAIPANKTLQLGSSGSTLIILDNAFTGTGNLRTMRNGVAFRNVAQLPFGNLHVGFSGGNVILEGLSWTDFTNSCFKGYGSGTNQWQLGGGAGFASRGNKLVIVGSGPVGGGAEAKTWFDRDAHFGGTWDDRVRLYADAPVEVFVNTELTGRRMWSSSSSAGPGLVRTHTNAALNRYAGNITDQVAAGTGTNRGALRFEGNYGNDEIILAGVNDWRGSSCEPSLYIGSGSDTNTLNTGSGGLVARIAAGGAMYVQFESNESLPRGNGGLPAWLAALSRYSGACGYFFTAKAGGETYAPRAGYRFLLGANGHSTPTIGVLGGSGEAGTRATLRDSVVCIHSGQAADPMTLELIARGPCEFVLGVPGEGTNGAVVFTPTRGFDRNVDTGIGGAATVVADATGARTTRLRGDGTVVLGHVEYKKLDGATDTSGQFRWELGVGGMATAFEGALRETGTNLWDSTRNFPVYFQGGVLELGAADFERATAGAPTAGQVSLYGGGFAAYGADRSVNLNSGAFFDWGNTGGGYTHGSYPLIFGSRTANATVNFLNNIGLATSGTGQRLFATIRGGGAGPEGRILGAITNVGSTMGINLIGLTTRGGEPIPAGTLELAHTNNTFNGAVNVLAGTLLVSGGIMGGTAVVTVTNRATLGGGGIVKRPVTILAGGRLAPGNLAVGTLTIQGNLTLSENAIYAWEFASGSGDRTVVTGTMTLPTTATVELSLSGGTPPSGQVLLSAGAVAGATDLGGWTITGVPNPSSYRVVLQGTQVVLQKAGEGTLFILR